jgi:hypothetical protein
MRERPILFSSAMILALLAGKKTQTRRVAKGVASVHAHTGEPLAQLDSAGPRVPCPYGQPGDQLWVRESFAAHWMYDNLPPSQARSEREDLRDTDNRWYFADGHDAPSQRGAPVAGLRGKSRPSIHMPRWASRISLEITGVRVERLQDISNADSIAEGAAGHPDGPWHAYRSLWTLINGPESWEANPWVWVVSFKVIKP